MNDFDRVFGLQWHITNTCNQRCRHCYIYQGPEADQPTSNEMSLEECQRTVDRFISFAHGMECQPSIVVTGGDPLLRHDIWEVLAYLKERDVPFSLMGNPFLLNREACERIAEFGCLGYQMSLDGLEQTHNKMRKQGSYSATFRAVKLLKEAGIRTSIMTTVSGENMEEIPELIRVIVSHGVDSWAFARYCPTGTELSSSIAPLEYKRFLGKVWEVYTELAEQGTNFTLKDHLWKLFLFEKGQYTPPKENVVTDGCSCGISSLALLADGTVYACRRFESPIGSLKEQSFEDIFFGEPINQYREIERLEGCRDCELLYCCRGCHAVSHGAFGDYFQRDPQCWRFVE